MSKYVFKPYDPIFPKLFTKEQNRLKKFLEKDVLIEHVGSTAVPGLGGKGIIDIVIAADDKNGLLNVSSQLIKAGYYFDPDDGTKERLFHGRVVSDDRKYHVHLTFKSSKDWKEMISFRDYLKTHTEDFEKYANIKKHAVTISNQDREVYIKIKEPVILKIIQKALKS